MSSSPHQWSSPWIARACWLFAILLGGNAIFMLVAPITWYETTPGVVLTGPPNIHFIRDIGLIYLTIERFVQGLESEVRVLDANPEHGRTRARECGGIERVAVRVRVGVDQGLRADQVAREPVDDEALGLQRDHHERGVRRRLQPAGCAGQAEQRERQREARERAGHAQFSASGLTTSLRRSLPFR